MDVPMDDREQVEAIKKWWREYGRFTIVTFIIVLAASFGWTYFQQKRTQYSEYASILYEQLQYSLAKEKYNNFQAQADYLATKFKRAPYAQLANLALAAQMVKDNKLEDAQEKLHFVVLNSHEPGVRQIARVREARVLLALNKPEAALALLKPVEEQNYKPMIEEVRGDIYVALEQYDNARTAYIEALKGIAHEKMNRAILQMKYEQIAGHYNEVV